MRVMSIYIHFFKLFLYQPPPIILVLFVQDTNSESSFWFPNVSFVSESFCLMLQNPNLL